MPIFFLYFSRILSLQEVLLLESIYYISVVILEVPTGYFSDRIGRKTTLLLGSFFLSLACILYLLAGSFITLVFGQISFALHMSMISGTNTVFHYESLKSANREAEYGDREAIVNKYGNIAGGTAALLGGIVANYDLRYAYVLSLVAGIIAMAIAFKFYEPKIKKTTEKASQNFLKQIKITLSFLKVQPLGWIFIYFIVIFIISHVPYEFYQPYIELLAEQNLLMGISVTVISGFIYSGARYIAAIGAAYSMDWSRKIGLFNYLLLAVVAINIVVLLLGSMLSSWILIIVLLRSLPWAAVKAPINAIITPRIDSGQRATFHSMISLSCRLGFFLTLFLLSLVVDAHELTSWSNISRLLLICFVGGALCIVFLWTSGQKQLKQNN